MFDPLIEWIKKLWRLFVVSVKRLVKWVLAPFVYIYTLYKTSGWIIRIVLLVAVIPLIVSYLWLFWNAAWIRDYDTNYPDRFDLTHKMRTADEQVSTEGGGDTTKTCGKSAIVEIAADLIDFNVNRNMWMSSNPVYKAGIFWTIPWSHTWFLDNKAAFQRGVHQAVNRTLIELADALGRVRGTSRIDKNLKIAKGNIQFDQYTWYINPFDEQPFGPTTPSPTYYRKAKKSLDAFNDALSKCNATFDVRADNLLQFLDRIAKDTGSTSAEIKDRAANYNSGWFDTRADDIFWHANGELYAYYGILKAARSDFSDVIEQRGLEDLWSRMEEHIKLAIELDPAIVSNGREDGWMMPTHLTTIGFYILRARSNLVEIRSVLDR